MRFKEWKEVRLGDLLKFYNGKKRPTSKGLIPVYGGNGILDYCDDYNTEGDNIIIGRVGAYCGNVNHVMGKCWVSDNAILTKAKDSSDSIFMYYNLTNLKLNDLHIGSTQPLITQGILKSLNVKIPPLKEQKAIAHILSTLDEKIEVNNQINKNLEEIAQTIFKHWFVDFEFPNENGEPYKSSGGEMVESELGMIPKGWEVRELGEIIELHDSKRIPLSKNEREKRAKIYPYYGAASLMDYVDDYIFDGIYVLLGEDGTVIDEQGYPILQYVWGKFWVNNHAHVITGKKGISEEFIYILLKNTNVSGAITGAVQLKINQKNLKGLKIVIPSNLDKISRFSEIIYKNFEMLRLNSDKNQVLTNLRDTLLPKLMSGEIRVPLESEDDIS